MEQDRDARLLPGERNSRKLPQENPSRANVGGWNVEGWKGDPFSAYALRLYVAEDWVLRPLDAGAGDAGSAPQELKKDKRHDEKLRAAIRQKEERKR